MLNEFRQDLVSGEWVLFATGRGKRSDSKIRQVIYQSKDDCPFEESRLGDMEIVWAYPNRENWEVIIVKNKYASVKAGSCGGDFNFGPFKIHPAVGDHEVVIYKDHDNGFDKFTREQITQVIKVYKKRYSELLEASECAKYIQIFHNHGLESGATVYHSHSQIITTPILPPDVFHSISGSFQYYKSHNRRVYDVILEWEQKEQKRIIYENDKFIAFCPFVSKYPYEVRIFSKEGHAHFEQMPDDQDPLFADVMYVALQKIRLVLGKPSFNFFIHTAPVENKFVKTEFGVNMHEFYHWHMEIIPHLKIDAGFEIGTGVGVNIADPDETAEHLREVKIEPANK